MGEHHPRMETVSSEDLVHTLDIVFQVVVAEHYGNQEMFND